MPFVLMLGTKKQQSSGEEYRWVLLGLPEPPRDAEFCRRWDKAMNVPFILLQFTGRARVYPDLNAAFDGIRNSGFVRLPYVVQIEHFPKELFPADPSA